jgi:ABC-2 type transport system permease protein
MQVLWRVIVKEFQQLRRDKKMIPAMIVGPLVQLLALGFAANLDVRDIPFVLVDRDQSSASRELVDRFTGSGYFELVGVESEIGGVDRWLS